MKLTVDLLKLKYYYILYMQIGFSYVILRRKPWCLNTSQNILETTFEQLRAESEDIIDMYFEMSRVFDFMPDEDGLYGIEDVGALVDLIESERN